MKPRRHLWQLLIFCVPHQAMMNNDFSMDIDENMPLPISTTQFTWEPEQLQFLEQFAQNTDTISGWPTVTASSATQDVKYYGNPRMLLPHLLRSRSQQHLVEFNAERNPLLFVALPPGLQVPVDQDAGWALSHTSRFEVEAPPFCKPEFELLLYQEAKLTHLLERRRLPEQAIQYRGGSYWQVAYSWPQVKHGQVVMYLPVSNSECAYQLRYADRQVESGESKENKPMAISKRGHHPSIVIRGPIPTGVKRWIPLLYRIHTWYHAVPERGWFYSGWGRLREILAFTLITPKSGH